MDLARGIALTGGTGLLALWLVSAVPTGAPSQPPERDAQGAPPAQPLFDFDVQAARLAPRDRENDRSRQPNRNPFAFGTEPAAPEATAPSRPSSDRLEGDAESGEAEASHRFALIGIAERRTAGGDVQRVAIVSAPGELFLAAIGERVGDRFIVVAIGPDAVDLAEPGGDRRLHLPLR